MITIPGDGEKSLRRLVAALRALAAGRSNASGTVTLSTGTSTVVPFANCGEDSIPLLAPMSDGAASASAWVSAAQAGQFTITHAAGAAGRLMGFVCLG